MGHPNGGGISHLSIYVKKPFQSTMSMTMKSEDTGATTLPKNLSGESNKRREKMTKTSNKKKSFN
jgi:hypothetical protein